jgi:hypothetical protein
MFEEHIFYVIMTLKHKSSDACNFTTVHHYSCSIASLVVIINLSV